MKNTRRCPKCGGSDIICGTTAVNGAYDKLQAGVFKAARTDRWVSCGCDYCELWVARESLEGLKEFWGSPEGDGP